MSAINLASAFELFSDIENKMQRGGECPLDWRTRFPLLMFADTSLHPIQCDRVLHRSELSLLLASIAARRVDEKKWLTPAMAQCMAPYWWLCAIYGAGQENSWAHREHPVNVFFEQLLRFARAYQTDATSEPLLTSLAQKINAAATAALHAQSAEDALKPLQQWLIEQQNRVLDGDRQLLAKEMHLLRTTHVHSAVTRAIRYAMLGKSPHAKILAFIDNVWRKYLSVIYLRAGIENSEWDDAMADIDMMLWLSDGASVDDIRCALNADIAQLFERIRKASHSIRGVDQMVNEFIEWFADMIGSRANALPVEVDFGLNMNVAAAALLQPVATVTSASNDEQSLLQTLRNLNAGDAIHIRTFEGWQRARVIDVDRSHDIYLIGDSRGNRLAAMGRREIAASITAGKMALVDNGSFWNGIEADLANIVVQVAERWRADYMAKLDAQKRELEARLMAERDARRKAEAEAQARRIQAAREQADYEQRLQHCLELGKRLRAGAVVQIENSERKMRPAFLAMISGGNGQYVFVERNGRRVASLTQQEVVQALVENRLQVIESGSALDSTLSNMVKERRQFLQDEG